MPLPSLKSIKLAAGQYLATSYQITFKIATEFTADGNGNRVPSATNTIVLPCRLKRTSPNATIDRIFPGTDQHQTLFHGWVNAGTPPVFPEILRRQKTPVGTVVIDGIAGKIECSITAISTGSSAIGERFYARFTQD